MIRSNYIFISLLILSISTSQAVYSDFQYGTEPFFNLVIKVPGGGFYGDYGLFIANYLREINIDSEIKIQSGICFDKWLECNVIVRDWDLTIWQFDETVTLDLREFYTENGSKNIFGLSSEIPYNDESEDMQLAYQISNDLEEIEQAFINWEILMMDKILPILPLYAPRTYVSVWANTMGYEGRWGVADSTPYMYYDGYHQGQVSYDEFNMATTYDWYNLNPISKLSESENDIAKFVFEPVLQFSPDKAPLKTGLIENWDKINDFHFKFYLRNNLYWNPSYNCSSRDFDSEDLFSISEEELMIGIKGNFSNGFNQQVTANDAVFTFLALSNPDISEKAVKYSWMSNCYVDETNPLAFHVLIDGNPHTTEKEYYYSFWEQMRSFILPEFYLNSTETMINYTNGGDEYVGLYPEITHTDQWRSYSDSPFSCGKYMLDYRESNSITVLTRSPFWFGIGAIDGTNQDLDIEKIYVHVIPELESQLDEFKEGTLDWIDVTPLPLTRKQMQADPRFDVQTFIEINLSFIAFNLDRSFIGRDDNRVWLDATGKTDYTKALAVRKGICHIIDRYEMNQIIHDGEYLIGHEPSPIYFPWFYPGFTVIYNKDYDLAWEWMEAAGYGRPGNHYTTPTSTPTQTSTETSPTLTSISLDILYSLTGIAIVYLLRNVRRKKIKRIKE